MQITVNIPNETAARMLEGGADAGWALLELAGYTACENGRLSYLKLWRQFRKDRSG